MLENGVTRDMFLIACNPFYKNVRDLIISGFAQLGRHTDVFFSKHEINMVNLNDENNDKHKIRNKAINRV